MYQENKLIILLLLLVIILLSSCNKNSEYPKRYKNIPTGTPFYYGPKGNFYILPEEVIDSNSYRIRVYIDTTGSLKFEGIFKYSGNYYNPSYNNNLWKNILYFDDSSKIYVKGLIQDTLTLILKEITIQGGNKVK